MAKKRRKKVEKEAEGFEIVASDYSASNPNGIEASKPRKRAKGTNSLRNAHKGSNSGGTGSAAERKANELWFRKCGYGLELFSAYYQGQPGLVPQEEWASFWTCVHTPLPVAFRLNGRGTAAREKLESDLLQLGLAAPVPWAADHVSASGVWQCNADVTKQTLTKDGLARDVVQAALSSGLLNRQEAVSTLPVFALQCSVGDAVLDLCASPGSKTMQLLDDCCGLDEGGDDDSGGIRSSNTRGGKSNSSESRDAPRHRDARTALVVANDAHPARVKALMQSLQRHGRTAAERACLAVTCHRGEMFPAPKRPFHHHKSSGKCMEDSSVATKAGKKSASNAAAAAGVPSLGFDKVLADVPCSGDGTVRKDRSVLPRWTPAVSNQLHSVQVAIGWRGLELLKVGGLLAYSTCSLNPIEDEAVVAALLRKADQQAPGSVVVESWPASVLPLLRKRSGLFHWRVADYIENSDGAEAAGSEDIGSSSKFDSTSTSTNHQARRNHGSSIGGSSGNGGGDVEGGVDVSLRWHNSFNEAQEHGMAHAVPSLWPPSDREARAWQLNHCSRFLPHDQNTGGFFVALLRKVKPLTSAEANGQPAPAAPSPPSAAELAAGVLEALPWSEADALGASVKLKSAVARRRLLRRDPTADAEADATDLGADADTGAEKGMDTSEDSCDAVHVGPAGLLAFPKGSLCVASAGLPLEEYKLLTT